MTTTNDEQRFEAYWMRRGMNLVYNLTDMNIFRDTSLTGIESERARIKPLIEVIESQLYLESQGDTFDSEYVAMMLKEYNQHERG